MTMIQRGFLLGKVRGEDKGCEDDEKGGEHVERLSVEEVAYESRERSRQLNRINRSKGCASKIFKNGHGRTFQAQQDQVAVGTLKLSPPPVLHHGAHMRSSCTTLGMVWI